MKEAGKLLFCLLWQLNLRIQTTQYTNIVDSKGPENNQLLLVLHENCFLISRERFCVFFLLFVLSMQDLT